VVHEIENNSSLMHILVLDKGLSGSVIVHWSLELQNPILVVDFCSGHRKKILC
jgi:hypothetical protein